MQPQSQHISGTCPSCQASGPAGQPCGERVCTLKGYHFVPDLNPGVRASQVVDAAVGQRLGDYLLAGLLGQGGFGRVYVAYSLPDLGKAAVKVLEMEAGPAGMAKLKLTKFETEAQAMARLSHPNIVRLYQHGHHRGAPYLAMELVEHARTLWAEIERRASLREPFTLDEIASILNQTLSALEEAHGQGMIHRDIKPENLMLQTLPDGGPGARNLTIKVLDFGLAKFSEDRTATSILLGTPAYMAPEQLTRGPLGPWTDLAALGSIAFELLTGCRPFPGGGVQEMLAMKLDDRFDPMTVIADHELPSAVRAFLARAIARDVSSRHPDVPAFRADLEAALLALRQAHRDGFTVSVERLVEPTAMRLSVPPRVETTPPASLSPQPTRPKKRALLWATTFIALAGLGLGVAWFLSSRPSEDDALLTTRPPPGVRVAPGRSPRGSPESDAGHRPDETLHEVVLTRPLMVDTTEVTQAAWRAFFDNVPSTHAPCGEECPVDNVGWWDAIAFANERSKRDGLEPCYATRGCRGIPGDGQYRCQDARFEGLGCTGWRLPTEAEWEYLARAHGSPATRDEAWSESNAQVSYPAMACPSGQGACGTHRVATKRANAFGLHDMLGNVREWVHDAYGPYGDRDVQRDPTGPGGSGDRVIRGGSFLSEGSLLRVSARDRASPSTRAPDLGFRLVRSLR